MKKFAIVGIVTVIVLGFAWAQETEQPRRGAGGFRNMTEEQRQAFRERMANMSEEERAAMRERMRGAGGFGGFRRPMSQEDQLAAIKVIEEQTAKLKASIENYERPNREAMQDMSQEERTKLMEKMRAMFTERTQIITTLQEKIAGLSMRRPDPTLTREDIQELGAIQRLATEEKAPKTAERLQKLMAKFGRGMGGPRGGMMGPRGTREPGAGGAEAPARRPGRVRGATTENN
jgi:hypothetical protein